MFRFVALLLALLMPLQFVWGAAAAYCGHESPNGPGVQVTQHFGHHQHVHKADAKKVADIQLAGDNDCGTCHAGCSAVTSVPCITSVVPMTARRYVLPSEASLASALSRAPDRPQWLRLA